MNDIAADQSGAAGDHFIPVRKSDILQSLLEHGALRDAGALAGFRKLCRLLAAICHYDYLDDVEKLRDAYFYFNPEIDPPGCFDDAVRERAYADLLTTMVATLTDANFVEVSHQEVERAHSEHPTLRVATKAPQEDFREVRFFRRGCHKETIALPKRFGLLRTEPVETDVYDDVILLVAVKSSEEIVSKEVKRLRRAKIRPGSVLIKYFRNVACSDLRSLFPNVRVILSLRDKLMLSVPAVAGGVPIILNLASTVTVLFAVLGFDLGLRGTVRDDEVEKALAALSGLFALGLFVVRQWVSYQRQSLKYQKVLSDNFYFRNITNNAGVFDSIVGMAEDQEFKEVLLAYYFLLTAERPFDHAALKARIEAWMRSTFGATMSFAADDALAKLDRLGLLTRNGELLSVLPLDRAFARLDGVWDGFFATDAQAAQ